ncbi:CHC2 zinc finger domain-containing protein [uncultured Maribacter sp.]|uniref:CHC2 zinc finger domain-containing protein n=1 Tax=uncultured Maribacter sp. TaxID=431308 RepID=UPI0026057273|nr:CHC2 zinc finger domain-containing protein [uncultured Maribacter sp.]
MEISQIKKQLTITTLLEHYNIPIKNKHCHCPFHNDKVPSMQVYPKTNTVYCFSGNCAKSGTSIDVIDFIMHKEQLTKYEAIVRAKNMLGYSQTIAQVYQELKELGLRSGKVHAYLQQRGLIGLEDMASNYRSSSYYKYTQLRNCIIFPLKNKQGTVVSLYGRSFTNTLRNCHFYLKNRKGLYPNYPNAQTKQLILTESIIDAATLLLHANLPKNSAVLACYGTNGFTTEHAEAASQLKELATISIWFDGDGAGRAAAIKLQTQLQQQHPNTIIVVIATPKEEDINSLWTNNEDATIFTSLLQEATVTKTIQAPKQKIAPILQPKAPKKGLPKNLLKYLNTLIAQSGIVGENTSRLLLFIIASSYKTQKPLHAIVQGSSGSGKTHLIGKIADMIPVEDVLRFTRITESALYNFSEDMLVGKLLVIEDLDGLKEEALLAFRELVSNHQVSSGVSIKDKKGTIKSTTKIVRGVFSSMSATTKGSIYEDNMNRSFVLAVDESVAQTSKVIHYQNKRYAGEISKTKEQEAKEVLQEFIRNLQDIPVINPFATQLQLPNSVHKKRRLNEMFQSIIKQITFIHQKQRALKNGCIYSSLEDIEMAITILFDSIILKIDELEGTQRVFYESLFKAFGKNSFTRFEAMEATGFKKTQLQYHLNSLVQLEYLHQFGYGNRGFKYRIGFEDSIAKVRKNLKQHFEKQLKTLKGMVAPNTNGSQTNTNRTPELSN